VTSGQLIVILLITLPALALALLPLWRRRTGPGAAAPVAVDRRHELLEEKAAVYRTLKELAFDHESGYVSDDDYHASRERHEARAAEIVHALDALPEAPGEARSSAPPSTGPGEAGRRPARMTIALAGGVVLLLAAGVAAGLLASRSRAPGPARARVPLPAVSEREDVPPTAPPAPVAADPSPRAAPPSKRELAVMLQAANQQLNQGRYKEALAGYQAVLREEPGNVDALTRVGLLLAIGGHPDSALERFDQIITAHPDHALAYFYRGQVLFRARQDYAGAIRDWERYLELVPSGSEHDTVAGFLQEARNRQRR
jgi:tetratricopeptide (TPR) repeat protein